MALLLDDKIKELIANALLEDLGERGDITSSAIKNNEHVSAQIIAKEHGVMCGGEIVRSVFYSVNPDIQIDIIANDGDIIKNKDVLVRLSGFSKSILTAERTALNFLGRLCGIATATNQFKNALSGLKTQILDTRKTTPGWRKLEKYAVECGGGLNHRIGLYDMFLIKENHITAAGGITAAVKFCRDYMRKNSFNAEIEVETQNIKNVQEVLKLAVDRIMLDNMTMLEMKWCVSFVDGKIPLEASGNVTLDNVREIAQTGVDYISVGAITHSAKNFDASLLIQSDD